MTRLAAAATALALAAGDAHAAPKGSPWGARYFPDVALVTQEGRTVRFYTDLVKDKLVVINFIFTRCTKACPLETANLARAKRLLGSRVGRDIFMYSITLDPQHDTPVELKAYAQKFQAGPGWLFLTGKREDIDLIRSKLGDRSEVADHAVGVAVGNDPKGQWTTLSAVDDPGFLAMSIGEWMNVDPAEHAPVKSYAEAPRARVAPGERPFRTRCAACHTIGQGESIGPDLAGVTERRDRGWLTRWLSDPKELIEQRDPLALELLERHRRVQMPSLALGGAEVAELLEYIESRSRALKSARRRPATAPR